MEHGDASLWGSIDVCALVAVSAGVCAGNLLIPPSVAEGAEVASGETRDVEEGEDDGGTRGISRRGLLTNLLCGDFIEAAYPFIERSSVVNLAAYLGGGVTTEILVSSPPLRGGGNRGVLSSAYLPLLGSVALAENTGRMALTVACAFGCASYGTVVENVLWRRCGRWCRRRRESVKHKEG